MKRREEKENDRPIGPKELRKARKILEEYRRGKQTLEKRVVENDRWWRMRHWGPREEGDTAPRPCSAWLFNSLSNKHADAMDQFPSPVVLPREESDRQTADQLSKILPVLLERSGFEETYSTGWWRKLKNGTAVYGVFWDPGAGGGTGEAVVKEIDLLRIFWEPGITDLQQSRNVFTVELWDRQELSHRYPQAAAVPPRDGLPLTRYVREESFSDSEKVPVIDWYYKKPVLTEGDDGAWYEKEELHYCKFAGETVLYSSENEDLGPFYRHGQYPFVFDRLFLMEESPAGFGYVDVMKSGQMYIDRLNQILLQQALQYSRKRFFIRAGSTVNEEEFADWDRDFVHVAGTLGDENLRAIEVPPLDNVVYTMLVQKIDELKETSGNRDFSQGATAGGVTSGAAITALQEAGSKLSRDMIRASYRSFTQIGYFLIELIRQFYTEPRWFRVLGENGREDFIAFDNRGLTGKQPDLLWDMRRREPVFDLRVVSRKASAYATETQNEQAKELYASGFFDPQNGDQALCALSMMDFEGKELVEKKISAQLVQYKKAQALLTLQKGGTMSDTH